MKKDHESQIETATLAAFLEGELSEAERARVDTALRHDSDAKQRLTQVAHVRDVLSHQDNELEDIDLVPGVRHALLQPAPVPSRLPHSLAAGGVVVAASVALFVAVRPLGAPRDQEFQPRSALANAADSTRWAGVKIYRLREGLTPEPLQGKLSRDQGLLFSYTNLGAKPFDYLMVFALAGSGKIHWFYPAYEQAGSDPQSVHIERGVADLMLRDVVRHDYASGTLHVCALFSRAPLAVTQVEAWLEQQRGEPANAAPFSDTSLQCVRIEIE